MKGTTKAMRHFKDVDHRLWKALSSLPKSDFASVDERMERPVLHEKVFEDICETIVGQQLSGKAANTIWKRFLGQCPQVTSKSVLALNLEQLRGVGISYAKGRALHDLAYKVSTGSLALNDLKTVSDDELRSRLIAVRGIGPWTAEMILMFTLHRPDVFSPGDLGLQKGVQMVHAMKALPSHEQMHKKGLLWSPYRTYAALLLWRLVDSQKQQRVERRKGVQ